MFLSTVVSLIALISGSKVLATLMAMPFIILMLVLIYCSFYPSYVDIFGRPEVAAGPDPDSVPTVTPEEK
jgi:hypothetical protein